MPIDNHSLMKPATLAPASVPQRVGFASIAAPRADVIKSHDLFSSGDKIMTDEEFQKIKEGHPLSTEQKITTLAEIVIEALHHTLPEVEGYYDPIKDDLIKRLQGLM
jgi:hypothetical protein